MGLEWQTIIQSLNLTIVANWINFGILVAVLSWLLFRPAKEFIQEKRETIKSRIDNAQEKEETARELKKEREQELQEARERRSEIIERAERRAEEIVEEGREEAEKEAARIVEEAKKEAEQEKQEAFDELEEEYVDMALAGAEKVLEREISREDHEKFLNSLFDQLKEKELRTG
uniref:ATPase, F0 complex, subunit B, bacterial n=1 Tax=uncultured organism TaxID=155900 RepID=M1QAE7_9ZZZZ|nr:ATPase, F0 complex, subunit B, bacterial [uncultured organism]AGF93325.1 ATPase, F0 complex, subunit B, bacterial [uncultured organism]